MNPTSSGTVALASRNVLQPLAQVVCIHSMIFLPLVFYCACMCLICFNWYNLWNYNMKQKSRSQLCIMCLFFKFSTLSYHLMHCGSAGMKEKKITLLILNFTSCLITHSLSFVSILGTINKVEEACYVYFSTFWFVFA